MPSRSPPAASRARQNQGRAGAGPVDTETMKDLFELLVLLMVPMLVLLGIRYLNRREDSSYTSGTPSSSASTVSTARTRL